MQIWQAIVLGAVQGIAEFLPISSSGHLMLLQNWFGLEEGAFFFTMALHIGTLIPVVIVLFKDIIGLFKDKWKRLWLLVLATIPAGLVGFILSVGVDIDAFVGDNIWVLSIAFLITAGFMVFSELFSKKNNMINGINVKTALGMGLGQVLGTLPGISRSGSTILGATVMKVEKNERASFTFLMSIPTICAAVLLEIVKGVKGGTIGDIEVLPLVFGIVTAMITGYIAIKLMLNLIRKANYKWFALYLVGISIANLIIYFI